MPTRARSCDDVHAGAWMSSPSSSIRPVTRAAGDRVVHPVEAAEEGRFAAARWADEGGHPILVNLDRDLLQRLLFAVKDADPVGTHLGVAAGIQGVGDIAGSSIPDTSIDGADSGAAADSSARAASAAIATDGVGTGVVDVIGIFSFISITSGARSGCGGKLRGRSSAA